MRHRRLQAHTVDFLFTLSLFCVFTVCALLVVSIGVQAYRSTAAYLEGTYSARTALSYVTEKIRQHDAEGRTALTQLDGRNALLLTDEINGSVYETYIYSDEAWLYELTVRQGTEISSSMGQQILRVDEFSIEDAGNGFLRFTASDSQDQDYSFLLHLRSGSLHRMNSGLSGKE